MRMHKQNENDQICIICYSEHPHTTSAFCIQVNHPQLRVYILIIRRPLPLPPISFVVLSHLIYANCAVLSLKLSHTEEFQDVAYVLHFVIVRIHVSHQRAMQRTFIHIQFSICRTELNVKQLERIAHVCSQSFLINCTIRLCFSRMCALHV